MLSIYTLKSARKACDYFQTGNYYMSDTAHYQKENGIPDIALFQGQWFGKGAEALSLKGNATLNQFKDVLQGKLSAEIWMKNTLEGKYHRPGYDLTFSAPKS